MRYRLRTLLIVLAIGPPVLAAIIWAFVEFDGAMLPVYAAVLGIAGTTLALTFWFLRWARTVQEHIANSE